MKDGEAVSEDWSAIPWASELFPAHLIAIDYASDDSYPINREVCLFSWWLLLSFFLFFFFVVDFVIHWNETAMGLHVFPIPIPPPTSLSTRSL